MEEGRPTDVDPQEIVATVFRQAGFKVEQRVGVEPGTVDWFAITRSGFPRTKTYFRAIPTVPDDLDAALEELRAARERTGADRAIGIVMAGTLPEGYEPDLVGQSSILLTLRRWVLEVLGAADRVRRFITEIHSSAGELYLPRRARLASGEEVDADDYIDRWAQSPDGPTIVLEGPGGQTTVAHAVWRVARHFTERPNTVTPLIDWLDHTPQKSVLWQFALPVGYVRHQDQRPTRSLFYWDRWVEDSPSPDDVILNLLPPRRDEIDAWFERHLETRASFEHYRTARRRIEHFSELLNVLDNLVPILVAIRSLPLSSEINPIEGWTASVVISYARSLEAYATHYDEQRYAENAALEQFALEKTTLSPAIRNRMHRWSKYGWFDKESGTFTNELILHYFLARKIAREVREGHAEILVRYQLPKMVFFFLTLLAPDIAAGLTGSTAAGMEQKIREQAERIAQLGFAHRLNRPVGTMRQYLGEIREALDKEQREGLARPFKRLEQEIDYIERLAERTRVWEKGPSGEKESVLLRSLVEDELAPLREHHPEVDFTVEIPNDLYAIAIPDALRESFHCLVENALHAVLGTTRETSPHIVVLGRRTGSSIRLDIRDSGEGVNPGDRERIFEPFNTNKTGGIGKPRGTGLGLAIAKRFVEAMGGRIGLDATQEETCFFIELVAGKENG